MRRPRFELTIPARRLLPAHLAMLGGAALAVLAFLVIAAQRVGYPFEIEWLESETLELTRRLSDGLPTYTAPSIEIVQLPYAPFSFALAALIGTVTGVDHTLMRTISIVCTLVTFVLLYRLVSSETKSRTAGAIAVGVYAASFRITGAFFDVGKSDALFLMLSLGAIAVLRHTGRWRNAAIGGLLMALAVLTKQTALFFFAPMAIYLVATRPRFGLTFAGVAVGVAGVVSLVLHAITDGWHTFFVWQLLFEHDVIPGSKLAVFYDDLGAYWPSLLAALATAGIWARKAQWWPSAFYIAAIAGLVTGAWTGRLHTGGYENVFMPAALAAALMFGLAAGWVLARPSRTWAVYGVAVLAVVQLALLRYDIGKQIPDEADRRAGEDFIALLRAQPGDVFIPRHSTYAVMAGKPAYAGEGGIEDILRGTDAPTKASLVRSMHESIRSGRFAAIVLDGPDDTRGFPPDWQNYYLLSPQPPVPPDRLLPVVSRTGAPLELWVRR